MNPDDRALYDPRLDPDYPYNLHPTPKKEAPRMHVYKPREATLRGHVTTVGQDRNFLKWTQCGNNLGKLSVWIKEGGHGDLIEVEISPMRRDDIVAGLRAFADAIETL